MSDHINLDLVDTDGAVREAEEAVAGDSRADFFRKAALTGGAVLGSGVILGGFPEMSLAAKPSKKNDIAILNFALTLEYLENEFYKEALSKAGLTGNNLSYAKIVQAHEAAHVKAIPGIIKKLGGKPVKKPSFNFGTTTANQANFLKTAVTLEDTGVSAYAGQGPNLKTKAVVVAALEIHSVEARHAAALRILNNQNFAPNALDKPRTASKVLARAKPFIKK
jgi:hypothetical protein